jgi:hypothetical protein
MRLNLPTALVLALLSSFLPGCERIANDREEAASKSGAAGPSAAGGATGQASEGSTDEPARPSSK